MKPQPHSPHPLPDDSEDDADASHPGRPSKTRRKQASHDLQDLGEALIELPASRLDKLDLPENLRHAIDELARVRSHEGRRRQLQYVGKLMRGVDPEPLREAIAAQRLPSARETLALHDAERWRLRLVSDDNALTVWLREHPDTDAQALRSLIRAARKDRSDALAATRAGAEPRKSRAWRELFQQVRAGLGGTAPQEPVPHDDGEPDDE